MSAPRSCLKPTSTSSILQTKMQQQARSGVMRSTATSPTQARERNNTVAISRNYEGGLGLRGASAEGAKELSPARRGGLGEHTANVSAVGTAERIFPTALFFPPSPSAW